MPSPLIHKVSYSWTGWPKSGLFPDFDLRETLSSLKPVWKRDGIQVIAYKANEERVQITVNSVPSISAVTVAARLKGRLDHWLKGNGWSSGFKRKVGLRSLGGNTIDEVLPYISTQLDRCDLVDSRYIGNLNTVRWENPDIDLSKPIITCRGRYWNDFHFVVVAQNRSRLSTFARMRGVQAAALEWSRSLAEDGGKDLLCGLKSISIMPDHVHLAVRLPVMTVPKIAAVKLVSSLNNALGHAFYSERVYMGTFSVYSMGSVLRQA
jgi:hypothetical protein